MTETPLAALAQTVLLASIDTRKKNGPAFRLHARVSGEDLRFLESRIGRSLPTSLSEWLLAVGFGDIGEELSFREEWFMTIDTGQLSGGAIFAQDVLGNFYVFDDSDRIYYLSRSEHDFAPLAENFLKFIEELLGRNYRLIDWVDSLEVQSYDW